MNICENSLAMQRSWADMNYDILVQIFMLLNIMDIASNVSCVCRSWCAASKSCLLWHTIDLAVLTPQINSLQKFVACLDLEPSMRLMGKLNNALTLSGNNVTRLIFHFYDYIRDEHLLFAAERCPMLKQLVLPRWNQISDDGFVKAIRKLTRLESLTLPYLFCPSVTLAAVSANCKRLKEIKFVSLFDYELSSALIRHLPKIKVLSLRCTTVYKNALLLALMGLEDLEVLNISHSNLMNLLEGPTGMYLKPDANIMEKALQLKKFLFCQKEGCLKCQFVVNDWGHPRWHNCDQDFWRNDEVSSLKV